MLPSGPVRPPLRMGLPMGWVAKRWPCHQPAVGDAVEERLRPIPCSVNADCPPERTGAVEGKAEDKADKASAEQSDRRLAGVGAVAETEDKREDERRGPKAEGVAMAGVSEDGAVDPGKSPSERVLRVTAKKRLLEQSNQQKAERPKNAVSKGLPAAQQKRFELKKTEPAEQTDQQRKTEHAPEEAGQKLRQAMGSA